MSRSNLPTLVILPGFMGDPEEWTWLSDALSQHYECLVVDIAGFIQQSPLPLPHESNADFLNACEALWQWFTYHNALPDRTSLLGYSMGGRIALVWARQRPQAWQSILLESCHPGLSTDAERQARQSQDLKWAQTFASRPIEDTLTQWYQQAVYANLDADARRQRVAQHRSLDPQSLARQLLCFSLGWQPDLGQLPLLPTGYICGTLDPKYLALGKAMAEQNPALRLYQVADNGHNVHQESPQQFLALTTAFLTRTE